MKLDCYQVDTFTEKIFGGNPACVVPLAVWPADDVLLNIAMENAVAETAFFVRQADSIHLRWFTPEIEMDLCGHATLATAHVLKTILNYPENPILFDTLSGRLRVTTSGDLYSLDFPSRKPTPETPPEAILNAFSKAPVETLRARDYVLVYEREQDIRDIAINRQLFDTVNLGTGGVIVTAPGEQCDFVSRFFTPQASILEDPVTGSAHCSLVPYWSERLKKQTMTARQLSARGGELFCVDEGSRVLIRGKARTYSQSVLWTE
ncbi:PhzF family phenazine biosynthesis protein [Chryseolinea lacunae]|uniref:PhzF family phenazine biosynthesis protein n=1 Tax=Chryseolinea lacunae TaxID=2801331 RepID=A0ABS1KX82_9BACT|nr:PhzF family phenazine biosynthesis protein [Chryseolinea lacunae]MBL0744078.1 PhzF family phenazine biosynthesis protein [Chryseolinea lacunae]